MLGFFGVGRNFAPSYEVSLSLCKQMIEETDISARFSSGDEDSGRVLLLLLLLTASPLTIRMENGKKSRLLSVLFLRSFLPPRAKKRLQKRSVRICYLAPLSRLPSISLWRNVFCWDRRVVTLRPRIPPYKLIPEVRAPPEAMNNRDPRF